MNLRRDHYRRTYTLRVCPYHGHAKAGCCERDAILIETVPTQRLDELMSALALVKAERDMLREARQVVCYVGGAVLFGSREAVGQANAYLARLKADAEARAA